MEFSEEVLVAAHDCTKNQRDQLNRSQIVGCFHCCTLAAPFNVADIKEWTGGTAICPKCHVDALIGNAAVTPLTHEFLKAMHDRWFSSATSKTAEEFKNDTA